MNLIWMRQRKAALAGIALAAAAAMIPSAFGAEVGEAEMCVPLRQIDDSRVIDDKTILLRMLGSSPYRRIDLAHECTGLVTADSFNSATSIGQLCRQDILRIVREPIGSQCVIERIVIIDEAEAKELLARRP